MKTFIYPVHFLLAILLVGVTACGTQSSSEEDTDICSDAALASFEEEFYVTSHTPWLEGGFILNYDSEFKFLSLGEHAGASAGPDKEPIGGLTLFFDEPGVSVDRCFAKIVSATLSTTDARVGTAEEVNGKLYKLAPEAEESCDGPGLDGEDINLPVNAIEFFYVSSGRAKGWFCVVVQQVSPDSGEPFLISGIFSFPGFSFGN